MKRKETREKRQEARIFLPLLSFLFSLSSFLPLGAAGAADSAPPPVVAAQAWLLVDHDSGAVLAEHNADSPRAPASLTKLMVAYLAFERLRDGKLGLDEPVRVSEHAWAVNGARLFLRPGTTITVEELLKGMIVRSANDATLALAERLGGDEKRFVALMNEKARALGLTRTRFANVTGLDSRDGGGRAASGTAAEDREGHVSTARDLARLAGRLMRDFPERYAWFALKEFAWGDIRQYNRNALLWRDDAVDGVKTGQTKAAGWCVIASAKRGPMRLTATVLGARDDAARFDAAQRLLDWGFRRFETRLLYAAEVPATKVRVWLGDDSVLPLGVAQNLYLTLPRGEHDRLRVRLTVRDRIVAPVARGQKVGTLTLELDGKPYAEQPLVAMQDIHTGNALQRAWDELRLWLQ
jgi:D-alanyl-D-alanine carboxypeptidase (penicillin-binding protein 5/6)